MTVLHHDSKFRIRIQGPEVHGGDPENLDDPVIEKFYSDMHDTIDAALAAIEVMLSEKYPNLNVSVG